MPASARHWLSAPPGLLPLSASVPLILSHFHPLDQGTNHLTFAEPVGLFSTRIDLGSQVFQTSNNQTKLGLESRLIKALLPWLLQSGDTLS